MIIGCLLWMRRLTAPAVTPRFLVDDTSDRRSASSVPEAVLAR